MTFMLKIRTAEERRAEELAAARKQIADAVEAHVEAHAHALGYSSAAHLASYVASTVPAWAAEARVFIEWRDAVWQAAIAAMERDDLLLSCDLKSLLAELPTWQMP
jgi:hypothetical protein